jgi:hypothetical protein
MGFANTDIRVPLASRSVRVVEGVEMGEEPVGPCGYLLDGWLQQGRECSIT